MTNKPTFDRATSTVSSSSDKKDKKVELKEQAAVWIKKTKNGDDYLAIKVNLPGGESMFINAFKTKTKKSDKAADYVAFERTETNVGTNQT